MVSAFTKSSTAKETNLIKVHDQVLAVDGQELAGLPFRDAVEALKKPPTDGAQKTLRIRPSVKELPSE